MTIVTVILCKSMVMLKYLLFVAFLLWHLLTFLLFLIATDLLWNLHNHNNHDDDHLEDSDICC